MRQVIVQIEGVGAFRAPASIVADTLEVNRRENVYIVDPNGQTWLAMHDLMWLTSNG